MTERPGLVGASNLESFLLLSADPAYILDLHDVILELRSAGHSLAIASVDPPRPDDAVHQLRAGNTLTAGPTLVARGRQLALSVADRVLGRRRRALLGAKFDPWFRRSVQQADTLALLDGDASVAAPVARGFNSRVAVYTGATAVEMLRLRPAWDRFREAMDEALAEGERSTPAPDKLLAAVADLGARSSSGRVDLIPYEAELLKIARRLVRRGRNVEALALIAAVEDHLDATASGLEALRLSAHLAEYGDLQDGHERAVTAAVGRADRALGEGDLDHVVDLTTAALGLSFHRDLHADEPHSPLVDDPAGFLSPLRGEVMRVLTSQLERRQASVLRSAPAGTNVVVIPGSYGRFARPVIEALSAEPELSVSVLDLTEHNNAYRWLGVDPMMIEQRLRRSLSADVDADPDLLQKLDSADVVFVDWADKGAVWASMVVPEDIRLVVRVHSMDALSPWILLVDWTRVDDLIFVGAHLRDLVLDMLGSRLANVRTHVVPNVVELSEFAGVSEPGAQRTLALVGWGKRVKDPQWALDVLEMLLQQDASWRLLLIGSDFGPSRVPSTNQYAERFRRRARSDALRHSIDYVGETTKVAQHLHRAGYILSTSVRESFHLGVVEGVAAGAVPVVRNWPVFAARDGARSVYPPEWVVDTPREAADRISAVAGDRATEVRRAQQHLRQRFDPDETRGQLVRIILGSNR